MSNVLTYNKTIKNQSLLITNIQKIFTSRLPHAQVNSTNSITNVVYDPLTPTLTINFTNNVTTAEKAAVDLYVSTFYDNIALSVADAITYKHVNLLKTTDQAISSTVNAVNQILFDSYTYLDKYYFQLAYNQKYIYIQKPGIYIISFSVGASLTSGGNFGTNTIIQWSLAYDDTKSETLYITIPNTNVYTVHTNINNVTDSTMLTCSLNVTSSTGTYLRLSCKRISGTTPLTIDADQINLSIINAPGSSIYEGHISSNVTLSNAGTASNLNLGTDRLVQFPFTHTTGTSNITVAADGFILIFAKGTFNKTSGTDASYGSINVLRNGTIISNCSGYVNTLSASSNKSTAYVVNAINVTANDVISLQAALTVGTNLQLPSGETGILLVFLTPYSLRTCAGGLLSTTATSALISTTPIDVPLVTGSAILPVEPQGVLSNNSKITLLHSGLYLISASVTVLNSGIIVRECGLYVSVSYDLDKIYYYVPSSLSIKQLPIGQKVTLNIQLVMYLPSQAKLKLNCATNGALSDLITTVDNTNLTVMNFSCIDTIDTNVYGFGTQFYQINSDGVLDIVSDVYLERCKLITRPIPSGIYRLSISFDYNVASATTFSVQLIDNHTTTGNTYVLINKNLTDAPNTRNFTTVCYSTLLEGFHVLILQFASPSGIVVTISDTFIEMWKVQ